MGLFVCGSNEKNIGVVFDACDVYYLFFLSGPAFQKWGQWAATRNDMFPDLLCQELEQLQSSVPAHSWTFSEKMMESSLGIPSGKILEVFDEFETEPIASGSIAQVHRATLEGKVRFCSGIFVCNFMRVERN